MKSKLKDKKEITNSISPDNDTFLQKKLSDLMKEREELDKKISYLVSQIASPTYQTVISNPKRNWDIR